ncbi:MAG: hypothetical protein J3K34DRAFT_407969, partial [Monoraphidium minutum]
MTGFVTTSPPAHAPLKDAANSLEGSEPLEREGARAGALSSLGGARASSPGRRRHLTPNIFLTPRPMLPRPARMRPSLEWRIQPRTTPSARERLSSTHTALAIFEDLLGGGGRFRSGGGGSGREGAGSLEGSSGASEQRGRGARRPRCRA